MTIWHFASDNPWLAFFLALVALGGLNTILGFFINKPLRHMSIRKHGWPPAHCDADGDFRETDKEEGN